MNWLDLVILIILAGGLVEGVLRGFIRSVVGVVSVAAGIYMARLCGDDAAAWVADLWDLDPMLAEAIGYALLFTVISFAVSMLSRLMGELVKAAHLSGLNRLLGAGVGLMKGAIVALVIVFALGRIDQAKPFLPADIREHSLLFNPTYRLANDCLSITRSQFGQPRTDDTDGD
ncbi:MAG: CvpA family protein [Paludibacteraceae bacterium]|nr:CvpA family protein [Paludibacteraceae bacterium]